MQKGRERKRKREGCAIGRGKVETVEKEKVGDSVKDTAKSGEREREREKSVGDRNRKGREEREKETPAQPDFTHTASKWEQTTNTSHPQPAKSSR